MVTPATGVVVPVPFPFSDLSRARLRPAVVLAEAGRDDWILCQVTSNPYGDAQSTLLDESAFGAGSLRATSYARPGKLFTGNVGLMVANVATLNADLFSSIIQSVVNLLQRNLSR